MASVAYLAPLTGIDESECRRREKISNDLTAADVTVLQVADGPLSIESEIEHEVAVESILGLLDAHENEFDAFVIGCFGDPGIHAARELTSKPVVGPGTATFHTAAMLAEQFSCLTIRDITASKRRQIHRNHLTSRLASVRSVPSGVLDVDHGSETVIDEMVDAATLAVEEDGAEAVVPGCMTLAFMQVHDRIADELGVPFLDPVAISLETAASWARHGISHGPKSYVPFDRSARDFPFS
jgi:allantoin racemase